jgi:chemotaxis protein MotA
MSMLITANFDVFALSAFVNAPSVMLVLGGAVAGAFIAYPLNTFIAGMKATKTVLLPPQLDPAKAIQDIIGLANLVRKEGILSIEDAAKNMEDPFIQKGLGLVVDAVEPELVKNILETEMSYIEGRHADARGVWEFIDGAAPAWGMMGTLIGLILMLQDLSDPSAVGPGMAIALITTFYGSIVSNYVAKPMAAKLNKYSGEEMLLKQVLIEGILSIQAGDNPRNIEEKLKAFLAPKLREGVGVDAMRKPTAGGAEE